MKKTILMVLLALLCVSQLPAQEYEYVPFVREGVKWVYAINNNSDIPNWRDPNLPEGCYYRTLELKGDTLINGVAYKAMHKYGGNAINGQNDTVPIYLREENKVVYGIIPNGARYNDCPIYLAYSNVDTYSGREFVLYDFNDPVGFLSGFQVLGETFYQFNGMEVITVGSRQARRYNGLWGDVEFNLIEGVGLDARTQGYTLCFFMGYSPGVASFRFSHVIEDGKIVYRSLKYDEIRDDMQATSIAEIAGGQKVPAADENYYDLMGRRVGSDIPTTPGIYIRQGNKIVVR